MGRINCSCTPNSSTSNGGRTLKTRQLSQTEIDDNEINIIDIPLYPEQVFFAIDEIGILYYGVDFTISNNNRINITNNEVLANLEAGLTYQLEYDL